MSQRVLEQKIQTTQAAAARTAQTLQNVNERIAASDSGPMFEIENATLTSIQADSKAMNGNIADLLIDLDDLTNSFENDFSKMQAKTGAEKFIGFFAKGKANSMRQERVRNSSISEKLSELIETSNKIGTILVDQEAVLEASCKEVEANLEATFAKREATIVELESVRTQIRDMDLPMAELENRLSTATDNITRTELETQVSNMNKQYNELENTEKRLVVESQTLERYIEMNKTFVDSLQNQRSTQQVLIAKLNIDTQQRVVLYDATVKSLKTAEQQMAAHKINEIGVSTDKTVQTFAAAAGSASNSRMIEMMESHEGSMVFSEKIMAAKAASDARFNRQFAEIVRKHDTAVYGAE